jgi:hypothetical protein
MISVLKMLRLGFRDFRILLKVLTIIVMLSQTLAQAGPIALPTKTVPLIMPPNSGGTPAGAQPVHGEPFLFSIKCWGLTDINESDLGRCFASLITIKPGENLTPAAVACFQTSPTLPQESKSMLNTGCVMTNVQLCVGTRNSPNGQYCQPFTR